MLKGSRNWAKVLHFFALPTKENSVVLYISRGKVLAPYRKIEMLNLPHVLFWVVQNSISIVVAHLRGRRGGAS